MGAPNDAAREGHALYERGRAEADWTGVVEGSDRIARLEQRNRVHERHDAKSFSRLAADHRREADRGV